MRTIETENGQVVVADRLHEGRGHNIEGKVFGRLTAVRVVSSDGRRNLWLCRCECGRYTTRTVGGLKCSVKSGCKPACMECVTRYRKSYVSRTRESRREWYLSSYQTSGSLYTFDTLRRMAEDIASEINLTLGAGIDLEELRIQPDVLSLDELGDYESKREDSAAAAEISGFRGECARAFRDVAMTKVARGAEIRLAREK